MVANAERAVRPLLDSHAMGLLFWPVLNTPSGIDRPLYSTGAAGTALLNL